MNKNKKTSKRKIIALTAIILTLALIATATIAYFTDFTLPAKNTFTAGNVACEVTEDFTEGGTEKKNVAVKNNGNIDVFVRVAVTVNWVGNEGTDNAGKIYGSRTPDDYAKDYMVTHGSDYAQNWFKGSDGYYYYKNKVPAGETTTNVIDSLTVTQENVPEGYHLEVNVMANAIQADPETTVANAWKVTVTDGVIVSAP